MCIRQEDDYITLDQDQYVNNKVSQFEKSFQHEFKIKDSPPATTFVPRKNDCPTVDTQLKEVKLQGVNLYHRSIMGAFVYISCYTCPDITYAATKLEEYANNPDIRHY